MILREATEKDLQPMLALCKREWAHLGTPYTIDIDRLRRYCKQGHRIIVTYDKALVAALMAHPLETDRGSGYTVDILVVDHKRSDCMALVDAISMYACNIAASEGHRVVVSRWKESTFCVESVRYGRDVLGFTIDDQFQDIQQTGDAQAIISNILNRHPEWRLP